MTEEQKEFWQDVVMRLAIAGYAAMSVLPYVRDLSPWMVAFSTAVGATGGLWMAGRASNLHRTHRPSLIRGIAEGIAICLVVYAIVREIERRGPEISHETLVTVMVAVPAWFAAYALYMMVETRHGVQEPSRF